MYFCTSKNHDKGFVCSKSLFSRKYSPRKLILTDATDLGVGDLLTRNHITSCVYPRLSTNGGQFSEVTEGDGTG